MWLDSLFKAISALFVAITKITPSDVIREDNQRRLRIRRDSAEMIKIYDREYRRLKNHTEINIATDVKFSDDNLPDDQEKELIELLTARVTEYRKRHPVLFKRWLRENEIK